MRSALTTPYTPESTFRPGSHPGYLMGGQERVDCFVSVFLTPDRRADRSQEAGSAFTKEYLYKTVGYIF